MIESSQSIHSQLIPQAKDPDRGLEAAKVKVRARRPPDVRVGKTWIRKQSTSVCRDQLSAPIDRAAEQIIAETPTLMDSTAQTEYVDQLEATTMKFKIKEKSMNAAVDLAHRRAAGLQREKEQLQWEIKHKTKDNKELRNQIAIYK